VNRKCRCCGRTNSLVDAHRAYVGIQRYDYIALLLWNCECTSTLALELPNPTIKPVQEVINHAA
jgi:hypothetical protein